MPGEKPVSFVVPGEPARRATRGAAQDTPRTDLPRGRVKQAVRVSSTRTAGAGVRVTAVPGEDVVVFQLADGPSLVLHPEHARDLILAQEDTQGGTRGAGSRTPSGLSVPAQFRWRAPAGSVQLTRGRTRGFVGSVILKGVEVLTGVAVGAAADLAASQAVALVDAQVDPGVYALEPQALAPLKGRARPLDRVPAAPGASLLVLVHGTFSQTSGTFAKLWTHHPQHVASLFGHYGGRVYGLDHPTLGVSPIENALELAKVLPEGARLHLVTHSRGGLVAEVLAQVCANPDDDFAPFAESGYVTQREALRTLARLVRTRRLHVDRIVRVACPSRGTLLASRRLDAYVSVLKWTLEIAGLPVLPALVEFLGEVAQRRTDPALVAGLEAQMPNSPLVTWLHRDGSPIAGDLRVVAGDMEGDSLGSWLKTLLADAFYWTDNDLVVQTRSMYGGAPRTAPAAFALERGGAMSHFGYFANARSAEAIVSALVLDSPPAFRTIGPLSWAGESSTGTRAAAPLRGDGSSARPAVFLLPDIFGSHLKADGERIWIGTRLAARFDRLAYTGEADGVEPDGLVDGSYDALAAFLSATHDVMEFPFDWRRPLDEEAVRLAAAVEAALDARAASGEPVRILAHSMGGLLIRTLHLAAPLTWRRLLTHPQARVLMLGAPHQGMWLPMQVLAGDDTLGGVLNMAGAPGDRAAVRRVLAGFPGLLQLQAGLLDAGAALSKRETWQELDEADRKVIRDATPWHHLELQLDTFAWGLPPQAVLDGAAALRRRLDAQAAGDFDGFASRLVSVAGHARFTPTGYEVGAGGVHYVDTPGGDGRVTDGSARLDRIASYAAGADHAELPRTRDAFPAYLDLLQQGATERLPRKTTTPDREPARALRRSRPSREGTAAAPPEQVSEVFAMSHAPRQETPPDAALKVSVVNGDLTFIGQPLLIGHYRSLRLTGAEKVINQLTGSAMDASLKKGLYPERPGEHQIFVNTRHDSSNPWRPPRPEAVIVAGLGEEGKLRSADLVLTVRQAVLAWAQRLAERAAPPAEFDLAATLIGSGGSGITTGQSAQLVAQGVHEANERLADGGPHGGPGGAAWPRVGHLFLVELYLDRASEALSAVRMLAAASQRFAVTPVVMPGTAALPRPLESGYRGADYDFITAVAAADEHGEHAVAYTVDTRRARTEVRAQATQSALLRDLVTRSSNDQNTDTAIGRTLFQLLVPVELEPFLSGTTEAQLELDSQTAAIPWELLDATVRGSRDPRPWAIRAKLLRKLRTTEFRAQPSDATADDSVLVIGEPDCDPETYLRLAGARSEARAVEARFKSRLPSERIKALVSPDDERQRGADAPAVINALLERDWRIVHIAGHGEPPEKAGNPRGVVLSNGTFLGPREIRNMRTVPELVFVNCCHLSARPAEQLFSGGGDGCGRSYNRPQFAAGVSEELIKLGVRCVVAAGWAVEDEPAEIFATTFYDRLLDGYRFLDAVAAAREAAWELRGNTWAAYQCYGDPDWRFRTVPGEGGRVGESRTDAFAGISSARGLILALETLTVQGTYRTDGGQQARDAQRATIRRLEQDFTPRWGQLGRVAEAFGAAWAAAGDRAEAIAWYDRALSANDGGASVRAAEQRANLQVRSAWGVVDNAWRTRDHARSVLENLERDTAAAPSAKSDAAAALEIAERELAASAHASGQQLAEAIALLETLVALRPSMERESLLGSAYKRQALIDRAAGGTREEAAAIEAMKGHYEAAEKLGRDRKLPDLFYPGLNRLAAEILASPDADGRVRLDRAAVDAVRTGLSAKLLEDPDFWSYVGQTELRVYEALARVSLASELDAIKAEYADLHARVHDTGMWSSVYDQARFVLPLYMARASDEERRAAESLLKQLHAWSKM